MITIQPIDDKILVKPEMKDKQKTESGIYLPETTQNKPQIGTVVSVGNGRITSDGRRIPLTVKVGDKVIFSSFSGTKIQFDEDESKCLLMTERDILGIIQEA